MTANGNGPLTIVWDDGPGHGWGVNSSNHPEHAQPAQMLSSFLSSQHLRKIREHDWNCSTNPAIIVCYNWLCMSNLVLSVCAMRNIWQISAEQIWRDSKSFGKKKPVGCTCLLHHPNKLASVFCHMTNEVRQRIVLAMLYIFFYNILIITGTVMNVPYSLRLSSNMTFETAGVEMIRY